MSKKAILIGIFIVILFIASCDSRQRKLDAQQNIFIYKCDLNISFIASFDKTSDEFTISGFGGTRVLKHLLSGSGARYGNSEMIYWSKGDKATVEYKGKIYFCSTKNNKF
ncbi:MAG: MliC family protein [bacterium]